MNLDEIVFELNGWMRGRRVPRKAAAIFAAMTKREALLTSSIFDGREKLRGVDWLLKTDRMAKLRLTQIDAELSMLRLPKHSRDRILDSVAHEVAFSKDEHTDWIADLRDEAIRDKFVEQGILDEHQFADGIGAKFRE